MVISIKKISNEELEKIKGGTSVTVWAGIIYSTIIIFIPVFLTISISLSAVSNGQFILSK